MKTIAAARLRLGEFGRPACRPDVSAHARLTPPPFLHRTVSTLARMSQVFAKQLDRHRCARTSFAGRDDIRKKVSIIVTVRLLAAGRHNSRTTDRHSLAIGAAPITINCIRKGGLDKHCRADRSGETKHPMTHVPISSCKRRLQTYSITSSARASSVGGTVTSIAFAVFRLTTNSNLVGCSTGRSASLAPFARRST